MKERPILFSGEMVRAILAGEKTQTRRMMKPIFQKVPGLPVQNAETGEWAFVSPGCFNGAPCPYGVPGDRLWVKETWCQEGDGVWTPRNAAFGAGAILYRADEAEPKKGAWFPSIFMYRWASRLTLEIVSVRAERLQEISEADARAEGMESLRYWFDDEKTDPIGYLVNKQPGQKPSLSNLGYVDEAYDAYFYTWENINGKGSWDANPWVWVIEFKIVPQEPRP